MTVTSLCAGVGITRSAYYKGRRERRRRAVDEAMVVELIKRERAVQPRLGARKLMVVLAEDLKEAGIEIGRDRFFAVMRKHDLLIKRAKRGVRTTDSAHGFRTYPNRLKDLTVTGAHQALVSDITYVRTDEGFVYLSMLSDAWSRKIVGYCASDTLEAAGSIAALEMALAQVPEGATIVHHSDRGIQYCCREYVMALERRGVAISMTEIDHCYENAQAERLNGIVKQEYGLGGTFRTKEQARATIEQAVCLYNTRRPHVSLAYRTPEQVHGQAA